MNITFLGTGTSHGVPSIDCMLRGYEHCPRGVCREAAADPRHRRTRSSILVEWNDQTVLIDAGPDLREQCLREKILKIDAVLCTHGHADHIGGIPDIRSYSRQRSLPFYGSAESIGKIRATYSYAFDPSTPAGGGLPRITTTVIDGPFPLFDRTVIPIPVRHLGLEGCLGFRIGPLAYIPDIKTITPTGLENISGVKLLILNCLRRGPDHVSHLTLQQSVELARNIAPARCYFIHMSHDIHYRLDRAALDPWMDFAWDGLRISL